MQKTARAPFEVKLTPLRNAPQPPAPIGRTRLDKVFSGDLQGTAAGEMIGFMKEGVASGAYSALETVEGTLQGKKGSFMLHHTGVMTRGKPSLVIGIVPDSGTGELEGIRGECVLEVVEGKHTYVVTYTLER